MTEWLTEVRWSPYVVGAGIGILSWFTFLLSDRPLGCSTAFARTSGMVEKVFRGASVAVKPYYRKYEPVIDWEWMLVFGILFGSFFSSILSHNFQWQLVPDRWEGTFGHTVVLRYVTALVGGIFVGFGARWADGCTSGHGISGTMQLTVSSWIASIGFFAGGIVTAFLLYNVLGG